jgi:exoribonuclease R
MCHHAGKNCTAIHISVATLQPNGYTVSAQMMQLTDAHTHMGQLSMPCYVLQKRATQLLTDPPTDPDASIRQDLTHHEVLTIDDASTQDIDDGLAVEVLPDGRHKLWVHIADPTRWVTQGDPLDVEARHRAKTMYLPTGHHPVLLCL